MSLSDALSSKIFPRVMGKIIRRCSNLQMISGFCLNPPSNHRFTVYKQQIRLGESCSSSNDILSSHGGHPIVVRLSCWSWSTESRYIHRSPQRHRTHRKGSGASNEYGVWSPSIYSSSISSHSNTCEEIWFWPIEWTTVTTVSTQSCSSRRGQKGVRRGHGSRLYPSHIRLNRQKTTYSLRISRTVLGDRDFSNILTINSRSWYHLHFFFYFFYKFQDVAILVSHF